MIHSLVHARLPHWLGIVLLVSGLAVLAASPKLVAFSMWILERLHNWYLNIVADFSGIRYTLRSDALLWKAARLSYWFGILIAGLLLALFGTIILINSSRLQHIS